MLIKELLLGMILGFIISIPVGPINLIVIRRTLHHGRRSGLIVGFGAALADTIYGMIAAFSVVLVADFLVDHIWHTKIIGGIAFFLLGLHALRDGIKLRLSLQNGGSNTQSDAADQPQQSRQSQQQSTPALWIRSHTGPFLSTFLLTLTNPGTIVAFTIAFASLGLADMDLGQIDRTFLIVGVFLGASAWWGVVVLSVAMLRPSVTSTRLSRLDELAGIIIAIFGVVIFVSAFVQMPWQKDHIDNQPTTLIEPEDTLSHEAGSQNEP